MVLTEYLNNPNQFLNRLENIPMNSLAEEFLHSDEGEMSSQHNRSIKKATDLYWEFIYVFIHSLKNKDHDLETLNFAYHQLIRLLLLGDSDIYVFARGKTNIYRFYHHSITKNFLLIFKMIDDIERKNNTFIKRFLDDTKIIRSPIYWQALEEWVFSSELKSPNWAKSDLSSLQNMHDQDHQYVHDIIKPWTVIKDRVLELLEDRDRAIRTHAASIIGSYYRNPSKQSDHPPIVDMLDLIAEIENTKPGVAFGFYGLNEFQFNQNSLTQYIGHEELENWFCKIVGNRSKPEPLFYDTITFDFLVSSHAEGNLELCKKLALADRFDIVKHATRWYIMTKTLDTHFLKKLQQMLINVLYDVQPTTKTEIIWYLISEAKISLKPFDEDIDQHHSSKLDIWGMYIERSRPFELYINGIDHKTVNMVVHINQDNIWIAKDELEEIIPLWLPKKSKMSFSEMREESQGRQLTRYTHKNEISTVDCYFGPENNVTKVVFNDFPIAKEFDLDKWIQHIAIQYQN